jgi:uncharacterized membrane protein
MKYSLLTAALVVLLLFVLSVFVGRNSKPGTASSYILEKIIPHALLFAFLMLLVIFSVRSCVGRTASHPVHEAIFRNPQVEIMGSVLPREANSK